MFLDIVKTKYPHISSGVAMVAKVKSRTMYVLECPDCDLHYTEILADTNPISIIRSGCHVTWVAARVYPFENPTKYEFSALELPYRNTETRLLC